MMRPSAVATEGLKFCGGVQAKLTVQVIFSSLLHPSLPCFNRCNKASLSPTMSRTNWAPLIRLSIRREHENKNEHINSVAVFCRCSRVLRRRRSYGHLEVERGQVQDRCRVAEEHHGRLRGRGRQREDHHGWHRRRRQADA